MLWRIDNKLCKDDCYLVTPSLACNIANLSSAELRHQKLGHTNYRNLQKLVKCNVVHGLPDILDDQFRVCGPCQIEKHTQEPHKTVQKITTESLLIQLLHMDLMGHMQTESLSQKRYVFVCVDDFSRFTRVDFIREKSETFNNMFKILCLGLEVEKEGKVQRIRSDHGKEFENTDFQTFCEDRGITQEFSTPKTPQHNGVVKRKNITLQEIARTMVKASDVANKFWAKTLNTSCYICNRVYLRSKTLTTPHEIWKGRKPNVKHFHVFDQSTLF